MDKPSPRRTVETLPSTTLKQLPKLEHDALARRTPTERVSEVITKLVGNMGFLVAQVILISSWSLANLHLLPRLKPFDPFPFGILALIVSSESVF
jgi:uncharacterized membrane protein